MNVALIYDNLKYQNETAMLLDDAGYTVNLTFSNDSPWFETIKKDKPDVLIISVSTPGKNLLNQLVNFKEQSICPVVVLANEADISITQRVIMAGADTCVTGDVSVDRMRSLIEINLARYKQNKWQLEEIQTLKKTVEELESRLNDRTDIERAKGLLMKSYRMNEKDACNAMSRMAMETGNKPGEVARNFISITQVLG